MKTWKEYENKLPYPNRIDFSTAYWYSAGKVVAQREASGGEIVFHGENITNLGACLSETVLRKNDFMAAMNVYDAETARLTEVFRQDLFKDLGIENHPMRDRLFSKAWEDGHAHGFSEVYNCACNLVDLIELPKEAILVTPTHILLGNPRRAEQVQIYELAERLQELLK